MSLHRVLSILLCLWTLGFGPCFGNGQLADVNLDGYVDRVDLGIVIGCIRDRSADPTCERADLDGDGKVRGRELAIVARYLGARSSFLVYDVATFVELDSFASTYCLYSRMGAVAFSRGGALAFGRQVCGSDRDVTRFHWLRLD